MAVGTQYSRQEILAEVGKAGQERVQSTRFVSEESVSPEVQAAANLYAQAAGFDLVEEHLPEQTGRILASVATHFRHAPSRTIGLGASAALDAFGTAVAGTQGNGPRD